MVQVPFAADVFTWPAARPQLVGGRCRSCAATTFPTQVSCPRCGELAMERILLPRTGSLWTWTTQEFLPKEPYTGTETAETFRPFAVGLVQLGAEVRVEGRLTISDPAEISFGMPLELAIVPFRVEPDGTEVMSYAFGPVSGGPDD